MLRIVPEDSESLMGFAGTRVSITGPDGRRKSMLAAIRTAKDLKNFTILSPAKDRHYRDSFRWAPMDPDWKERREKIREEQEKALDPGMFRLRDILLSFGGEDACFVGNDEDLANILKYGQFWFGRGSRMMEGRPCQCHANAAALWENNQDNTRICTGYALSDDGIWRQHSWLLHLKDRSNQIIETTAKRIGYFGFCMTTEQCKHFAKENW